MTPRVMTRRGGHADDNLPFNGPMGYSTSSWRKVLRRRRLARARWVIPVIFVALVMLALAPMLLVYFLHIDDKSASDSGAGPGSSARYPAVDDASAIMHDPVTESARNISEHVVNLQQPREPPSDRKLDEREIVLHQTDRRNVSTLQDPQIGKLQQAIPQERDKGRSIADTPFSERPHDVMPSPSPWPRDEYPPPERLYGTSGERCFSLGVNLEAESLWQVNSRALCYIPTPICLSGSHLEHVITFQPRGSGSCNVLQVESGRTRRATEAELDGTCTRFRTQRVVSMFGSVEHFHPNYSAWKEQVDAQSGNRIGKNIKWHSANSGDLAILIPKYDWSWNICHYNRIWQYTLYVIRNLQLFVDDAKDIRSVQILFRAKSDYKSLWAAGMRDATLSAMQKQTGLRITVGKVRFDPWHDFQCFPRAILLGQEGRVDAYPFLNDTAVWSKESQEKDDHIPVIPHDALWMRQAAYRSFGFFESAAEISENGTFTSIPVPPLTVSNILRSPKSKRRFNEESRIWFDTMLMSLAENYGLDVRYTRFSAAMPLSEQAGLMRGIGMAVGIHGANFVNTIFMSPAGALFEIFPWRYVRYYYAGGANSGLRYSFHETSHGDDHHCDFSSFCFMKYRESVLDLSQHDREIIVQRLDRAMRYLRDLHRQFPTGRIPLVRRGNIYSLPLS